MFGKIAKVSTAVVLFASLSSAVAQAGTVVVNADEWALSDSGFTQAGAANVTRFVANLVGEFGGIIHAYSSNFGYTGSSLATAMTAAGASYSVGTGFDFTASNIAGFDALLLGGTYLSATEQDVLSDFVAGGKGVYISAGTGIGGAAG